ncbi:MAG: DNA repair exonuclease [Clostridia bacterium]|nr:DNA repair exonuclease [Clostridia bacterium]
MIRIFHTGDVHLDASFYRKDAKERAAERQRQRELFKKMMKYALENKFDIVLISGDLFDGGSITPETEKCVIDAFSSLACPVVISPGNHDAFLKTPIYSQNKLPENVYVFNSAEIQIFPFEELGAEVCGYAFMNDTYYENPLENVNLPYSDGIRILCAHAELGVRTSAYASISESDVERLGVSYAALGHIHKQVDAVRRGNSVIAYCGFPEGRAFDELGEGGALSVTIDGGEVSISKLIFGERRYYTEELSVGFVGSADDVIEKIRKYLDENGFDEKTALRLSLTGEADASFAFDKKEIENAFSERLLQFEAINKLLPRIDLDSLEKDRTLRGEIFRVLRPELESENQDEKREAFAALKAALWAIEGREPEDII